VEQTEGCLGINAGRAIAATVFIVSGQYSPSVPSRLGDRPSTDRVFQNALPARSKNPQGFGWVWNNPPQQDCNQSCSDDSFGLFYPLEQRVPLVVAHEDIHDIPFGVQSKGNF